MRRQLKSNLPQISHNLLYILTIVATILGSSNGLTGEFAEEVDIPNKVFDSPDTLIVGQTGQHNDKALTPVPLLGRRGNNNKSRGNLDDSRSEEDESDQKPCVRLPPRPPKSHSPQLSINFMNLLNDGSKYMTADDNVKDVILVMGNTGAGKTTLTQIVAGDLRRTHAVLTQSNRLVIVDDDNRIGAPTTVSKTLVPELILKQYGEDEEPSQTPTAFYDCPGFDDTRGLDQDIATNFFMNQIVRRMERVKMLFIAIHSSVMRGNDRLDFDLLATHATKYVKNIQSYRKSVGLVISKVSNYDHAGKYVSDRFILKEIVEFLQDYNNTLHSQLSSNSSLIPTIELERKIQFVNILLEKNKWGQYGRISFSRNPNLCGPLSESKIATATRQKIVHLYSEELEYTPVDWRDFGYTLKDKTRLHLRSYLEPLNEQVAKGMSLLMNNFNDWYKAKYSHKMDVTLILNEFRKSANLMNNLTLQLSTSEDPQQTLEILTPTLEALGYSVPINVEKFMRQQQAYFDFFDEANAARLNRNQLEWIIPIKLTAKKFEDFYAWYEFCEGLQTAMKKYGFQLGKPKIKMDQVDWLHVVENDCKIPVSNKIRTLSSSLDASHLDVLENIVKFALQRAEIKCTGSRATVTGNYVRLSEFISKNGRLLVNQCDTAKHVEVYAAHILFIDRDVNAEGMELNLAMIAPYWVVVDGNRHINLNGSPGPRYDYSIAASGQDGAGGSGFHGLTGKPGGPGGSFFGLALHTKELGKLTITSVGGNGGDGQGGGHGGRGSDGRNAERSEVISRPRVHEVIAVVYTKFKDEYDHEGHPGYPGGNGGDGGKPGKGGEPGNILLFMNDKSNKPRMIKGYGNVGQPGSGGVGGVGGTRGMGMYCVDEWATYVIIPIKDQSCNTKRYKSDKALSGKNGAEGQSSLGYVEARNPTRTIVEWQSIFNYKLSTIHALHNNDTKDFFRFLDTAPTVQKYFDVAELATELEKISKDNLEALLQPYIERVERLSKQNSGSMTAENKKVAAYLLTSAYSKLRVSDQEYGLGMVVDLDQFFNVVKQEMQKLKQVSALEAIDNERLRFAKDLDRKISEVKKFREDLVTPAVHAAEAELQVNLGNLGKDFENLIVDSEIHLDVSKRQLKNAIQRKKSESIMAAISTIFQFIDLTISVASFAVTGGAAAAAGLGPKLVGTATSISKSLKSNGPGSNDEVSKLTEVVNEAEGNLKDALNRKSQIEQSFIPVVDSMIESLNGVMADLQRNGEPSIIITSELGIKKWQITWVLRDVKEQLEMLGKGVETRQLATALDRVQDALTMQIDLIEDIEKYEDTRKQAEYMAAVNSAALKSIQVRDSSLSSAVTQMEKTIRLNTFMMDYQKVLHAFKQWVFPFAKVHLTKDLQLKNIVAEEGEMTFMKHVETLKLQWDRYKGSTLVAHDTHLMHTNFTSTQKSSTPFFVWQNQKWHQEIRDLLSGKPVHFKADVRLSPNDKDAVKFKLIEINCKIPREGQTSRENQQSLNSELEHFGVVMTHSGVSYYRFQNKFYVMKGANQTIRYNFERDSGSGNRLGTNRIYEKFRKGDYLLSPYTLWTIQLVRTSTDDLTSFQSLERFAPHVDLELVGTGIYADGKQLKDDMDAEKYYVRDESLIQGVDL